MCAFAICADVSKRNKKLLIEAKARRWSAKEKNERQIVLLAAKMHCKRDEIRWRRCQQQRRREWRNGKSKIDLTWSEWKRTRERGIREASKRISFAYQIRWNPISEHFRAHFRFLFVCFLIGFVAAKTWRIIVKPNFISVVIWLCRTHEFSLISTVGNALCLHRFLFFRILSLHWNHRCQSTTV